ncbi:YbjQ family protein [Psychrobacter lutiphocae]|uniref:YbjQ family protein n=1 Tax=Psychrobacter lutiphocae TaxID=540500 RepID=UPI00035EEA18|nr:YbjQ family protein [Psychrobacter lutiphocae]
MSVLLSNLEHLPGYTITERLDVVYGSTVRSKHVGKDIFASLKNIVGGELTAYTELLEESRQEAIDRMLVKAQALGADAIVGLRFSTSSIAQGASELFVYGTAVRVVPNNNPPQSVTAPPPLSSEPTFESESSDVPPLPGSSANANTDQL